MSVNNIIMRNGKMKIKYSNKKNDFKVSLLKDHMGKSYTKHYVPVKTYRSHRSK